MRFAIGLPAARIGGNQQQIVSPLVYDIRATDDLQPIDSTTKFFGFPSLTDQALPLGMTVLAPLWYLIPAVHQKVYLAVAIDPHLLEAASQVPFGKQAVVERVKINVSREGSSKSVKSEFVNFGTHLFLNIFSSATIFQHSFIECF